MHYNLHQFDTFLRLTLFYCLLSRFFPRIMEGNDGLPNDFDVVVYGTGLEESIWAAACARLGWTVLHLDTNDFYGGPWSSANFESLQKWISMNELKLDCSNTTDQSTVPTTAQGIFFNVEQTWHSSAFERCGTGIAHNTGLQATGDVPKSEEVVSEDSSNADDKTSDDELNDSGASVVIETPQTPKSYKDVILSDQWRRFSIDLAPKVLLGRGEMVSTLVKSGVGRYAEFKLVNKILSVLSTGEVTSVPCSRSDVFQSKQISVIEKRLLMKFLNSCLNYRNEYENKTFGEFLDSHNLTPILKHYVITSIAMMPLHSSANEGIKTVETFLMSVGRYGNSPFLFPIYGCGELPQCFCRLCAVFGGIYCLNRSIENVFTDADGRFSGLMSNGQRITCRTLVVSADLVSTLQELGDVNVIEERFVSHAVLLTDKSLVPSNKDSLSVYSIPSPLLSSHVTALELPSSAMVCPKDFFVTYLFVSSCTSNARSDLQDTVTSLFDVDGTKSEKPRLIWSLYYNKAFRNLKTSWPNVVITCGPDSTKDFESAIVRVKEGFRAMWPDDEFLPAAPDPDDIDLVADPGINGFTPDPQTDFTANADHSFSSDVIASSESTILQQNMNLDDESKAAASTAPDAFTSDTSSS